jgi:alkanesulfonate monooxygenase SsuD/methylene tetrahydromethanopterin reductase-like flavin-dependent oxidoreductase (luciferase family)
VSEQPVHLALALSDVGWHPAAWRETPSPERVFDADYWLAQVQLAERGLLDFVTFEDRFELQRDGYGPQTPRIDQLRGRLDAVLIASRIAPLTKNIGLVPAIVAAHTEPFHISKAIATLDYISTGRAGLRVQGGGSNDEAKLFGRRTFPEITGDVFSDPELTRAIERLFDEAADYIEVVRRLWDSWEDDAEIRDVATGRFIDRDKLHYADFVGEHFSVKGPSIVPRPPQGQPLVSVLAHAAIPYRLGARSADVTYVTPHDDDDATKVLGEVHEQELAVDRRDPHLVFSDLVVILADDEAAAQERRARLDQLASTEYFSDALIFTGTPSQLADLIERWHAVGYAGFRLRPAVNAVDVPAIVDGLVPELQRRGLFRTAYEASTLRGLLGLERPDSRYVSTAGNDDLVEAR